MSGSSILALGATQGGLGLIALAVLACWPPHNGSILLVPVQAGDRGAAVRAALAAGATLVDTGPVAGSIVVNGDLARLRASTTGTDIVVLAAPFSGCGAELGA